MTNKSFLPRRSSLAVAALLSVGVSQVALAQSTSPAQSLLDAGVVFNVGAFVLSTDLRGRLNGQSTINPDIDFDETFGTENNATRVRIDALVRITPTHHLRLLYFDDTRNASSVLEQPLEWGDYTFQPGSRADLKNKLTIGELAYEYAFIRETGLELAGSVGLHLMKLRIGLSGAATVADGNGNVSPVAFATKDSDLSAPLPVIGLRAAWVVSPSWFVEAQGQVFKAKLNGYDGSVTDLRLGATWMYNRNYGLGFGYNHFSTSVDVTRDAFDGRLRTGYSGFQLYLTAAI